MHCYFDSCERSLTRSSLRLPYGDAAEGAEDFGFDVDADGGGGGGFDASGFGAGFGASD